MMNAGESSCGELIYMDDVWGSEKVNDTCVKTMHAKMMATRQLKYVLFGLIKSLQIAQQQWNAMG
jgi:hypothetical protein